MGNVIESVERLPEAGEESVVSVRSIEVPLNVDVSAASDVASVAP